jgi:hypothetical protein
VDPASMIVPLETKLATEKELVRLFPTQFDIALMKFFDVVPDVVHEEKLLGIVKPNGKYKSI